jgi:predicted SAM-dependent methyltransferase
MKLHLGCGKRNLKGYVHVDIENYDHIDHVSSIDNLAFIEDSSVSEIYSSHAFEYFDRVQSISVLAEWHRVLEPGGELYLTVPNFRSLIEIYTVTNDLNAIIGPLFGRWENGDNTIYHRTTWDFQSLSSRLEEVGFLQISSFDPVAFLGSVDPTFDDYSLAFFPHMDHTGIPVSLAMKAQKAFNV